MRCVLLVVLLISACSQDASKENESDASPDDNLSIQSEDTPTSETDPDAATSSPGPISEEEGENEEIDGEKDKDEVELAEDFRDRVMTFGKGGSLEIYDHQAEGSPAESAVTPIKTFFTRSGDIFVASRVTARSPIRMHFSIRHLNGDLNKEFKPVEILGRWSNIRQMTELPDGRILLNGIENSYSCFLAVIPAEGGSIKRLFKEIAIDQDGQTHTDHCEVPNLLFRDGKVFFERLITKNHDGDKVTEYFVTDPSFKKAEKIEASKVGFARFDKSNDTVIGPYNKWTLKLENPNPPPFSPPRKLFRLESELILVSLINECQTCSSQLKISRINNSGKIIKSTLLAVSDEDPKAYIDLEYNLEVKIVPNGKYAIGVTFPNEVEKSYLRLLKEDLSTETIIPGIVYAANLTILDASSVLISAYDAGLQKVTWEDNKTTIWSPFPDWQKFSEPNLRCSGSNEFGSIKLFREILTTYLTYLDETGQIFTDSGEYIAAQYCYPTSTGFEIHDLFNFSRYDKKGELIETTKYPEILLNKTAILIKILLPAQTAIKFGFLIRIRSRHLKLT